MKITDQGSKMRSPWLSISFARLLDKYSQLRLSRCAPRNAISTTVATKATASA